MGLLVGLSSVGCRANHRPLASTLQRIVKRIGSASVIWIDFFARAYEGPDAAERRLRFAKLHGNTGAFAWPK